MTRWGFVGSTCITFLASTCLSGCYAARHVPFRDAPLVLQSATPMHVKIVNAEGDVSAATCPMLRATVTVRQLDGDTLFFSRIQPSTQEPATTACRPMAAGYIDLAANPGIQTVTYRSDARRTALASVIAVVVVLGFMVSSLVTLAANLQ